MKECTYCFSFRCFFRLLRVCPSIMRWKLYPSITSIGLRLFDSVLIIIGLSGVEYDGDSIDEVDDADAFLIEDYFPF